MKDQYKPLDKYEARLIKAIENDEFVPVANQKKEIKRLSGYFKNIPRKNKRITIRINETDLTQIQDRAIKNGLSYQTLITLLLHRYAKGNIEVSI